MNTAAFAPATKLHIAPAATGRRAVSACLEGGRSAPVINMGLEEIQKQAKAA